MSVSNYLQSHQPASGDVRLTPEGGFETRVTITPLSPALSPKYRKERRQTLAISDAVNVFGRRRSLSPRQRAKRHSELNIFSKSNKSRSPDLVVEDLPPDQKQSSALHLSFVLTEIELENGGN